MLVVEFCTVSLLLGGFGALQACAVVDARCFSSVAILKAFHAPFSTSVSLASLIFPHGNPLDTGWCWNGFGCSSTLVVALLGNGILWHEGLGHDCLGHGCLS